MYVYGGGLKNLFQALNPTFYHSDVLFYDN